MLVAVISLTALLGLAGITLLQVRGSIKASGHARYQTIAQYAAESGVSAGMDFLRANVDPVANWGSLVTAGNTSPGQPAGLPGTNAKPGETGNLFSPHLQAWYEVVILNNQTDPGFRAGDDTDGRVVIRSTGHGPNRARIVVEVEVRAPGSSATGRPCPGYAQRGMAEDGAGRNDCLSVVDGASAATFRPGGR